MNTSADGKLAPMKSYHLQWLSSDWYQCIFRKWSEVLYPGFFSLRPFLVQYALTPSQNCPNPILFGNAHCQYPYRCHWKDSPRKPITASPTSFDLIYVAGRYIWRRCLKRQGTRSMVKRSFRIPEVVSRTVQPLGWFSTLKSKDCKSGSYGNMLLKVLTINQVKSRRNCCWRYRWKYWYWSCTCV